MDIKFKYMGIASGVLIINNKVFIGLDPAFSPLGHIAVFKNFESKRVKAPVYDEELIRKVDLWLITHCHEDHLDDLGVMEIKKNNTFVVCDSNKTKNKLEGINGKILKWGEEYAFEKSNISIKIKSIPAFHGNNFIMRKIVGKVNGYLISIKENDELKKIYITGDTVYHRSIVDKLPNRIDTMIANMGNAKSDMFGGTLTLNIEMLNKFVKVLSPNVIIPVHVDDFSHYDMTMDDIKNAGYMMIMPGDEVNC